MTTSLEQQWDGGGTADPRRVRDVALIVLNWNSWQNTLECLESLQRLKSHDYLMVVVDNGSRDDSLAQKRAWAQGEVRVRSKFFDHDPTSNYCVD